MSMFDSLKRNLFTITPEEASFQRREFECDDERVRLHLEEVLRVFISGYNLTLRIPDHEQLVKRFETDFDKHQIGFAMEGAGMCCALFDLVAPRRTSRLREFTEAEGRDHDYIATVGAGLAVARLPYGLRVMDRYTKRLDPMLAWCVIDGYGFHQGIFHHPLFVKECKDPPPSLAGYARLLFDSGLGRSLWWVMGASPKRITVAIDNFPEARRAEMWHGVGVGSSYAGGVEEEVLLELLELSGAYRADFRSGVTYAARMRQKGGNPSPATDLACKLLLQTTVDDAANLAVRCFREIADAWTGSPREMGTSGYVLVRQRLTRELQLWDIEKPLTFH